MNFRSLLGNVRHIGNQTIFLFLMSLQKSTNLVSLPCIFLARCAMSLWDEMPQSGTQKESIHHLRVTKSQFVENLSF